MPRLAPELTALSLAALVAAMVGGLARAAPVSASPALDSPSVLDSPSALESLDEPIRSPRPSSALLVAQPPRGMAFVLDGPTHPVFPLLSSFRDASVERHGPMRLYLSGRWGAWVKTPWRTYSWEPMLSPGDDAAAEADAMGDLAVVRGKGPAQRWAGAEALVRLDVDATLPPVAAAARDRAWAPEGWSPASPLFDTSGASTLGDGFDVLYDLPPEKPVRDWRCQRRPVTIVRYGAESDAFELVRCDGSMQPDALDRLSILARPPEVPRPASLPDDPDPVSWSARHEWLPNVRVVHPRLVWALQQLVDAFPRRNVYVFSGYRPMARVGGGRIASGQGDKGQKDRGQGDDGRDDDPGIGHKSLHADGRALDMMVQGIANEELLKACRKLADVGCGYYPNSKFVHVDVRPARTGKAFWIDASAPGEPSRYVDSWPGVVESGAMSWVPESARVRPQ